MNLEKISELFEHITDKDMFAALYSCKLANRLLQESSASTDSEKSFIAKMKMRCGAQFTNKMEGMITDLNLAEDISQKFASEVTEQSVDFNVQVLTRGHWPSYRICPDLKLPATMADSVATFEKFYKKIANYKTLTFIHSLGSVTMGATFPNGRKHDLVLNTLQACVLDLFNYHEVLNYNDIKELLKFDDENCKKTLHSMACFKYKILEKKPAGKSIDVNDAFCINPNFNCNVWKIRLPVPRNEEIYSRTKVSEDRTIAIEAAIVRIMKSRKQLNHQQLIQEVLTLLQMFRPDVKVIKTRIDVLIEREYLERDATDRNIYKYLA